RRRHPLRAAGGVAAPAPPHRRHGVPARAGGRLAARRRRGAGAPAPRARRRAGPPPPRAGPRARPPPGAAPGLRRPPPPAPPGPNVGVTIPLRPRPGEKPDHVGVGWKTYAYPLPSAGSLAAIIDETLGPDD